MAGGSVLIKNRGRGGFPRRRRGRGKGAGGMSVGRGGGLNIFFRARHSHQGNLSVNSPALILSKNSGVSLAKIG